MKAWSAKKERSESGVVGDAMAYRGFYPPLCVGLTIIVKLADAKSRRWRWRYGYRLVTFHACFPHVGPWTPLHGPYLQSKSSQTSKAAGTSNACCQHMLSLRGAITLSHT